MGAGFLIMIVAAMMIMKIPSFLLRKLGMGQGESAINSGADRMSKGLFRGARDLALMRAMKKTGKDFSNKLNDRKTSDQAKKSMDNEKKAMDIANNKSTSNIEKPTANHPKGSTMADVASKKADGTSNTADKLNPNNPSFSLDDNAMFNDTADSMTGRKIPERDDAKVSHRMGQIGKAMNGGAVGKVARGVGNAALAQAHLGLGLGKTMLGSQGGRSFRSASTAAKRSAQLFKSAIPSPSKMAKGISNSASSLANKGKDLFNHVHDKAGQPNSLFGRVGGSVNGMRDAAKKTLLSRNGSLASSNAPVVPADTNYAGGAGIVTKAFDNGRTGLDKKSGYVFDDQNLANTGISELSENMPTANELMDGRELANGLDNVNTAPDTHNDSYDNNSDVKHMPNMDSPNSTVDSSDINNLGGTVNGQPDVDNTNRYGDPNINGMADINYPDSMLGTSDSNNTSDINNGQPDVDNTNWSMSDSNANGMPNIDENGDVIGDDAISPGGITENRPDDLNQADEPFNYDNLSNGQNIEDSSNTPFAYDDSLDNGGDADSSQHVGEPLDNVRGYEVGNYDPNSAGDANGDQLIQTDAVDPTSVGQQQTALSMNSDGTTDNIPFAPASSIIGSPNNSVDGQNNAQLDPGSNLLTSALSRYGNQASGNPLYSNDNIGDPAVSGITGSLDLANGATTGGFRNLLSDNGARFVNQLAGNEPGANGGDGTQGINGFSTANNGLDGDSVIGAAGTNGVQGEHGSGRDGINGHGGWNGINGHNGWNGINGHYGKNGINGHNGKNAINLKNPRKKDYVVFSTNFNRKKGKFVGASSKLNGSSYQAQLQRMNKAFGEGHKKAIKEYNKRGITGVSTDRKGNMVIIGNKSKLGVNKQGGIHVAGQYQGGRKVMATKYKQGSKHITSNRHTGANKFGYPHSKDAVYATMNFDRKKGEFIGNSKYLNGSNYQRQLQNVSRAFKTGNVAEMRKYQAHGITGVATKKDGRMVIQGSKSKLGITSVLPAGKLGKRYKGAYKKDGRYFVGMQSNQNVTADERSKNPFQFALAQTEQYSANSVPVSDKYAFKPGAVPMRDVKTTNIPHAQATNYSINTDQFSKATKFNSIQQLHNRKGMYQATISHANREGDFGKTQYGQNINDAINAFNTGDQSAINAYRQRGLQDIQETPDHKSYTFTFNGDNAGLQQVGHVQNEDGSIVQNMVFNNKNNLDDPALNPIQEMVDISNRDLTANNQMQGLGGVEPQAPALPEGSSVLNKTDFSDSSDVDNIIDNLNFNSVNHNN